MENQIITKEHIKTTPKDFFLYLASIVTLYIVTGSLLRIFFVAIDNYFKDSLNSYYYGYSFGNPLSWPAAILIILFPIFLAIMWSIKKDILQNPLKRDLKIRKWLIYLTLFATGAIIAGDLVTLLYYFLNGENITANFISKVLVVLVIAAIIFGYYIYDLKDKVTKEKDRVFAIVAALIILTSLVLGFAILGSPAEQRRIKFDINRINDLSEIQTQVVEYWRNKGILPENLTSLNNDLSGYRAPLDPRTSENYTYKKLTELQFELCATFETVDNSTSTKEQLTYTYAVNVNENWKHDKGITCFKRAIDPDVIKRNTPLINVI